MTREYTVTGRACQHFVRAVEEQVSALPGVQAVDVELGSGRLSVDGSVPEDRVRAAVREAGYEAAAA